MTNNEEHDHIQRFPMPEDRTRVETGAIQFGDDWPGLHLRGDDCIMLVSALFAVTEKLDLDADFANMTDQDLHVYIQGRWLRSLMNLVHEDVLGSGPVDQKGEDSVNDE